MMDNVTVASEWKEIFRMSHPTFMELYEDRRPLLERKSTRMRRPISLETQMAFTLYYLSDEGRYRKVANAFGISRSFPELSLCVNGQESQYPFSVNASESKYSKIDESGNIYDSGTIPLV